MTIFNIHHFSALIKHLDHIYTDVKLTFLPFNLTAKNANILTAYYNCESKLYLYEISPTDIKKLKPFLPSLQSYPTKMNKYIINGIILSDHNDKAYFIQSEQEHEHQEFIKESLKLTLILCLRNNLENQTNLIKWIKNNEFMTDKILAIFPEMLKDKLQIAINSLTLGHHVQAFKQSKKFQQEKC